MNTFQKKLFLRRKYEQIARHFATCQVPMYGTRAHLGRPRTSLEQSVAILARGNGPHTDLWEHLWIDREASNHYRWGELADELRVWVDDCGCRLWIEDVGATHKEGPVYLALDAENLTRGYIAAGDGEFGTNAHPSSDGLRILSWDIHSLRKLSLQPSESLLEDVRRVEAGQAPIGSWCNHAINAFLWKGWTVDMAKTYVHTALRRATFLGAGDPYATMLLKLEEDA